LPALVATYEPEVGRDRGKIIIASDLRFSKIERGRVGTSFSLIIYKTRSSSKNVFKKYMRVTYLLLAQH
jgi:hypothetical protein